MEDTEKQEPTQWFVFFKDQLLLKKEKTEKRVIWVRVMAILLALLLAGSVLGVIFTTAAV